jgi:hypothetical protein
MTELQSLPVILSEAKDLGLKPSMFSVNPLRRVVPRQDMNNTELARLINRLGTWEKTQWPVWANLANCEGAPMLRIKEGAGSPVAHDVDVLIAGGGPAGVAAGFAAARMGSSALIVEQFNCLGGVATAGGHGHICLFSAYGSNTRVVGGIPYEIARRVVDAGFGRFDERNLDFEIEGMKLVLERMAEECGCQLLYHTFFCDTVVDSGKVVGAVIQNKAGRQLIRAKRFIDCTGDGDVAFHAGCEFEIGDPDTGHCQPATLMFTIGGVDWPRFHEFLGSDWKLTDVWKRAQDAGDMRPFQTQAMGWWWTPTRPDQVGVNFTHINFVDSTRAEDLTQATIEGRKQAFESISVFRKYVPGMENCYMVSTPNTVGIRESRRIRGEYTLTRDDVVDARQFDDSIGYGSFFIDIHSTAGPGMDSKTWRPPRDFRYQIPYRILVPKNVDNLLVAGRCVSCDHEALGSLRVMPQCGVMGQAAGVASVLSLHQDISPRKIDVKALQDELRRQKCIISEIDIV